MQHDESRSLSLFLEQAVHEASTVLAHSLVTGIERCSLNEQPLTELQTIDLLAASLMSFDGYRNSLQDIADTLHAIVAVRRFTCR